MDVDFLRSSFLRFDTDSDRTLRLVMKGRKGERKKGEGGDMKKKANRKKEERKKKKRKEDEEKRGEENEV